MARNYTIFHNIDRAFSGNWTPEEHGPRINSYDMSTAEKGVLYRTTNKDDYESKKLELQQNAYLRERWIKANVDLSVTAYAGLNNVKLMYRDADLMDSFPEIGASLDIVAEESTITSDKGMVVNVYSKSDRIKSILEDLFVNRLNIQVTAPMVVRAMCKYGNQFMLLDIDNKLGVKGWKQLPVFNVERIENGVANPYSKGMQTIATQNTDTSDVDTSTKFVWVDDNSGQVPFRNWQVAHFRLLTNSLYLPYGCIVGESRIETEYGHKQIRDINIGDKVWTFNISSKERELSEVTMKMNKGEKDVYYVGTDHHAIKGTSDHKLLTYNQVEDSLAYKEIKDLEISDLLVVNNELKDHNLTEWFSTEKITKIEYVGKSETFDITVANENSNFFANGIVTHNCSYLNAARRHWRMLSLMEDMMLIYRLERSIERRVYKIYVGAIDDADVQAYVENIANNFKRTPIIDPMTGQIDLRKNILSVDQDIFIPVRDQNAPTPIDTLSAAQNLTAMDDIKFVQNKVCTALRIPKTFLNFEQAEGNGNNLALEDIRFTRTVNRIQQAFLMELTKVASIHLYLLGFTDDLTNFNLTMNNPSTQAEQLEIENVQKKISAARDAISDPGNGIPIMSQTRALKEIMKWSEKEIRDNLEEIRLEKGIAAELEKTSQIIKRTGLFDTVDRMYGEPGAEYQEDLQQQGNSIGGGGLGGAVGGASGGLPGDFGNGLDDLGSPEGEENGDIAGAEGSEPTAEMGENQTNDMNGGNESENNPMESHRNRKPIINEAKQKAYRRAIKNSEKKADQLFSQYLRHLDKVNENKKQETSIEKADIYDKSLMINEEFSKMLSGLDKKLNEDNEKVDI